MSWTQSVAEHLACIGRMEAAGPTLDAIVLLLVEQLRIGGRVLIFGNGGSAADAQHIAAELIGRFRQERPALAAIALTTDTSALTAIGNDYGFEHIFARQVTGLLRPGDVAWGLSTSGRSPNVVNGLKAARELGGHTIGFTGAEGAGMGVYCDWLLAVPAGRTDRIQECHQLAYHYICEQVERAFVK